MDSYKMHSKTRHSNNREKERKTTKCHAQRTVVNVVDRSLAASLTTVDLNVLNTTIKGFSSQSGFHKRPNKL